MALITGQTRDGHEWIPEFIKEIDKSLCVGCGRCFKTCTKGVLAFKEEDTEETVKAYMTIAAGGNCIGCQSCGQTCPNKCFSFSPVESSFYGYTA